MLFAMVRSEIERKFVDWSEQRASYFRHPAIDTCAGNIRAHVGIELCMEFSLADVRSYAPDSSF